MILWLEAALAFVMKKFKPPAILVWGSSYSANLVVPTFIAFSRGEAATREPNFRSIPADNKLFFVPSSGEGEHGSPALEASCLQNGEYWAAAENYLLQWTRNLLFHSFL